MYTLSLTQDEYNTLRWISARYNYADVLCKGATLKEGPEDNTTGLYVYEIPEHEAWAFQIAVEEEDGFLTCAGGGLLEKLQNLLDEIV